ncbi:hypothetical protein L596_027469 [Steinernema carpocapsae]|uniref:Uncharacterized protein n=1 Tax=Steinernema carpocapsae TaxID=34508 RepID=A0A4U5LVK5_STECR|nr:hypothetical protein L596_027469 [Steinernema carpocapsae]
MNLSNDVTIQNRVSVNNIGMTNSLSHEVDYGSRSALAFFVGLCKSSPQNSETNCWHLKLNFVQPLATEKSLLINKHLIGHD